MSSTNSSYSLIHEAWGQTVPASKTDPICTLVSDEYNDDIMNTYFASDLGIVPVKKQVERNIKLQQEKKPSYQGSTTFSPTKEQANSKSCFDGDNLNGYVGFKGTLLDTAYPFDNYYIENNFVDDIDHKEQTKQDEISKENILKTVALEQFDQSSNNVQPLQGGTSVQGNINNDKLKAKLDLGLYVASGFFLIFFFEQIFNIGVKSVS